MFSTFFNKEQEDKFAINSSQSLLNIGQSADQLESEWRRQKYNWQLWSNLEAGFGGIYNTKMALVKKTSSSSEPLRKLSSQHFVLRIKDVINGDKFYFYKG